MRTSLLVRRRHNSVATVDDRDVPRPSRSDGFLGTDGFGASRRQRSTAEPGKAGPVMSLSRQTTSICRGVHVPGARLLPVGIAIVVGPVCSSSGTNSFRIDNDRRTTSPVRRSAAQEFSTPLPASTPMLFVPSFGLATTVIFLGSAPRLTNSTANLLGGLHELLKSGVKRGAIHTPCGRCCPRMEPDARDV